MIDDIPKVNIEIIAKTLKKLEKDPEKCKQLFRYWFSSPNNIIPFSKFCFPEYILGSSPEFHNDFYNYLLRDGDDSWGAPRGHGKSTLGLILNAFNLVNKREKYTVYISQNHSKTVQFIEPLSVEFKTNNRLR